MEIIWKNIEGKSTLNHERSINLEYAVRLQVVKILINEAEHLMDYLSLVVMEINPSNGHVSVHQETPEPLFSKISNNLEQPKTKENAKISSPLLAAVNV
ncbi:hypothetical protein PY092_03645 [Muricauda sp. 334s03]|uniref:Uncharacterized protein n=1 Tax=Flagellimonas yonaguniensis TaxID=3031325 RepID=A0ABT5XVM6_9FLAO|nr:hypothetical protein [[Muricauda] yonaguniensis]MDF0715234.1 hypothetical protein [[Muricauda] yonaguniensis]